MLKSCPVGYINANDLLIALHLFNEFQVAHVCIERCV